MRLIQSNVYRAASLLLGKPVEHAQERREKKRERERTHKLIDGRGVGVRSRSRAAIDRASPIGNRASRASSRR